MNDMPGIIDPASKTISHLSIPRHPAVSRHDYPYARPGFSERWAVWGRGDEFGGGLERLQLICGFDSEFAIHTSGASRASGENVLFYGVFHYRTSKRPPDRIVVRYRIGCIHLVCRSLIGRCCPRRIRHHRLSVLV